jgi:hypothetical protein
MRRTPIGFAGVVAGFLFALVMIKVYPISKGSQVSLLFYFIRLLNFLSSSIRCSGVALK